MNRRVVGIAGWLTLAFALFHVGFPWLFGWRESLAPMVERDRGILFALHVHSTYLLFVFAWLSAVHARGLLETPVGRALSWAIAAFWFLRVVNEQLIFDDPSAAIEVSCFAMGLLYAVPLWRTRPGGAPANVPAPNP